MFGQQGYGYSVNYLYEEIGNILGLNKEYQLVVVGYGRLGQAMASYIYKNEKNFHIRGIFDVKEIIRDVAVSYTHLDVYKRQQQGSFRSAEDRNRSRMRALQLREPQADRAGTAGEQQMAELVIRQAEERDIAAIETLEQQCFAVPWTYE